MKKVLFQKFICFLFLLILAFAMISCSKPIPDDTNENEVEEPSEENNDGEEPGNNEPQLSNYFPLTLGSTWTYLGEGNEYAEFSREVIYVSENKAQVKESNPGTVSAHVFEVTPDTITRVFFQGEEYDDENFLEEPSNDDTILLKLPLEVGTKWTDGDETREIVDITNSVTTPLGIFENCIKVEITTPTSTMYEYYKEGTGLVKREFVAGDDIISSTLESYDIK